jgi:uncharacterized protein (DUF302 family)
MSRTSDDLGFQVRLDIPYEQAIEKTTAALKTEGFGVLTEIDVKETLKQKLDADFRRYVILGACNPPLAHRALSADLDVGLMLPCNVIVYEEGDGSVVNIIDPLVMLGIAGMGPYDPALSEVAEEANARLERVAEHLKT